MAVFRVNFEDKLYLDYLQQLERYPQRIFIDKGDPFNTLHEIQFHARHIRPISDHFVSIFRAKC